METKKAIDTPEIKLHFLDYWRILRIRKTVIIVVFLLTTITSALVSLLLMPKKYSSTARIAVQKDLPDITPLVP